MAGATLDLPVQPDRLEARLTEPDWRILESRART
jgi:hypothetical protein